MKNVTISVTMDDQLLCEVVKEQNRLSELLGAPVSRSAAFSKLIRQGLRAEEAVGDHC